ncbi:MAG: histone [Deltaproteobacteria bacterium]|nr:histone [Deltaproteobacteria bacterium]
MSELWGMLSPLMETTQMTDQNDSDVATAPVARYAELQALVAGMAADFEKFFKDGNKAAGTRVRNAMQELKTFAQAVRNEVTTLKNEGAKES